jgi:Domain of unknown function (DUF4440)
MNSQNDQITALLSEWAAPEASGDTATLKRCLADDFTGVGPLGFTLSRQDWLARPPPGPLAAVARGDGETGALATMARRSLDPFRRAAALECLRTGWPDHPGLAAAISAARSRSACLTFLKHPNDGCQ